MQQRHILFAPRGMYLCQCRRLHIAQHRKFTGHHPVVAEPVYLFLVYLHHTLRSHGAQYRLRQPRALQQRGLRHLRRLAPLARMPRHIQQRQQHLLLLLGSVHCIKCLVQRICVTLPGGHLHICHFTRRIAFHQFLRYHKGAAVQQTGGCHAHAGQTGGFLYVGNAHALARMVECLQYYGLAFAQTGVGALLIVRVQLHKRLALNLQPRRQCGFEHIAHRTQVILCHPLPQLQLRPTQYRLLIQCHAYRLHLIPLWFLIG